MPAAPSLRVLGTAFVVLAFLVGAVSTWAWVQSDARWRLHQATAKSVGVALYATLQTGTSAPTGITITPLSDADDTLATEGDFLQTSLAPQVVRTTIVPILPDAARGRIAEALTIVLLSPDIVYPLAGLQQRSGQTAAETTGEVFRLLSSYCSDPVILVRVGVSRWQSVSGAPIWGCAAAPPDLRLLAAVGAIISMAILISVLHNTTAHFTSFANLLRNRRKLDGPFEYATKGPQELQDIVTSVNAHLELERSRLEARAAILSGVSHDLGTPAARLRLRTALIKDDTLRTKLEADIDRMTGIIESVLTYTRVEMNAEAPRKLSLNSLIDAIVADYQDMGRPVVFREPKEVIMQGGRSVFMSRQGKSVVPNDRNIIASVRPIALERAITNLVDNAIKYGRRATLSLEADAQTATIVVEDDGSNISAQDLESLMAPFKRGDNAVTLDGHGLGLTIVATIAELHGGSLVFDDYSGGISARLIIQRD